jgi:hypothetical protein
MLKVKSNWLVVAVFVLHLTVLPFSAQAQYSEQTTESKNLLKTNQFSVFDWKRDFVSNRQNPISVKSFRFLGITDDGTQLMSAESDVGTQLLLAEESGDVYDFLCYVACKAAGGSPDFCRVACKVLLTE